LKQSYKDFEVIVVDNGSQDNSVNLALSHPLKPIVIKLEKNYGFARAVNLGIEKASSPLIALLNNDAFPDRNWLKNLLLSARAHPEMDFFASLVLRAEEQERIESAGVSWNLQARAEPLFENQVLSPFLKNYEVFLASGTAVLFRRALWEELGGFDEDYFAYLEDVGFFLKARIGGKRGMLVKEAVVYHFGARTELEDRKGKKPIESSQRVYLIARNRWWLVWEHLPLSIIFLLFPLIIWGWFRGLGYHLLISRQIVPFLRGSWKGFFSFPRRQKARKKVFSLWKIKKTRLIKFMKKGFWELE